MSNSCYDPFVYGIYSVINIVYLIYFVLCRVFSFTIAKIDSLRRGKHCKLILPEKQTVELNTEM